MAANKKPKKKYKPRIVHYPTIIIAMHSIEPIEKALDTLIETGELLVDDFGNYVYRTGEGLEESFEAGLDIYNFVVQELCRMRNITWQPDALINLREAFLSDEGFDEDDLIEAKECLAQCRKIISITHPLTLREVVSKVRVYRAKNKPSP